MREHALLKADRKAARLLFGRQRGPDGKQATVSRYAGKKIARWTGCEEDQGVVWFHTALAVLALMGLGMLVLVPCPTPKGNEVSP